MQAAIVQLEKTMEECYTHEELSEIIADLNDKWRDKVNIYITDLEVLQCANKSLEESSKKIV